MFWRKNKNVEPIAPSGVASTVGESIDTDEDLANLPKDLEIIGESVCYMGEERKHSPSRLYRNFNDYMIRQIRKR